MMVLSCEEQKQTLEVMDLDALRKDSRGGILPECEDGTRISSESKSSDLLTRLARAR